MDELRGSTDRPRLGRPRATSCRRRVVRAAVNSPTVQQSASSRVLLSNLVKVRVDKSRKKHEKTWTIDGLLDMQYWCQVTKHRV